MATQGSQRSGSHFASSDAESTEQNATKSTTVSRNTSGEFQRISSGVKGYTPSERTVRTVSRLSQHATYGQNKKSHNVLFGVITGAVAVAIVVVLVVFVMPRVFEDNSDIEDSNLQEEGTMVQITIPSGAYATDIATILYDSGLISSTSDFLSTVVRLDAESTLKSGTYTITAGSDISSIISLLQAGAPEGITVTIPEGYTVYSIAQAVSQVYSVGAEDFIAQAKASNYAGDYWFLSSAQNDSLEGYLFPKTYSFESVEVSSDQLIRTMLDQFATETESLDLNAAASTLSERYGIEITVNNIVTMASIVEREALTDEQRPLVASVFYNRLSIGMALQSDATLWYSLGEAPTQDQLNNLDDPYNTYLNTGLTPTPICAPSISSLTAACNPEDTSYYYFAIYSEDDYEFNENYNDHVNFVNAHN